MAYEEVWGQMRYLSDAEPEDEEMDIEEDESFDCHMDRHGACGKAGS